MLPGSECEETVEKPTPGPLGEVADRGIAFVGGRAGQNQRRTFGFHVGGRAVPTVALLEHLRDRRTLIGVAGGQEVLARGVAAAVASARTSADDRQRAEQCRGGQAGAPRHARWLDTEITSPVR